MGFFYEPREIEHPIKKRVRLRTSFFFADVQSPSVHKKIPYFKWVDLINLYYMHFDRPDRLFEFII